MDCTQRTLLQQTDAILAKPCLIELLVDTFQGKDSPESAAIGGLGG